jgi:hypothetical protein
MLAPTVLIITSGLAGKAAPDALDRAIKQLAWMKKNIILVLGSDGDDIMRTCSQMDACEIVFDPNDAGPFSPVKAGLHATDAPAFIWRPDRPFPEADVFQLLESALRTDAFLEADLLCADGDRSGLLLTTPRSAKSLKERPADAPWPSSPDLVLQTITQADPSS